MTFEITSGKSDGEIARKRIPPSFKTDSSTGVDYLQLIMVEEIGSLGGDNLKIDWRKKYSKRKKTISQIKEYAIRYFSDHEYKWLSKNC